MKKQLVLLLVALFTCINFTAFGMMEKIKKIREDKRQSVKVMANKIEAPEVDPTATVVSKEYKPALKMLCRKKKWYISYQAPQAVEGTDILHSNPNLEEFVLDLLDTIKMHRSHNAPLEINLHGTCDVLKSHKNAILELLGQTDKKDEPRDIKPVQLSTHASGPAFLRWLAPTFKYGTALAVGACALKAYQYFMCNNCL